MINEDGVEIEHGMVVYEPWKGGYYLKKDADAKIAELEKELSELRKENEDLKNELFSVKTDMAMTTRWHKYPEEKPDVKPDEAEYFLVVVDYYNTYDLKSTRGRYVTEAEYYVGETGCFYRAYSDQEIDETFYGENGEECYEKVIMWRPLPKAPEVK